MPALRNTLVATAVISLTACSSLAPTLPTSSDTGYGTLESNPACSDFVKRYGSDKPLPRFATTLVSGKRPLLATDAARANGADHEQLAFDDIERDFDSFLNCYYVDLSEHLRRAGADDKAKEELLALRGHAIVTVMARYAAYNMTGVIAGGLHATNFEPYDALSSDAAALLTRIEYAERLLRRDSKTARQFEAKPVPQVDRTAASLHGFPRVKRSNRVFSVVQVAFEAERPTARRAVGFLTRLAGLFAGPGVSDLKSVVNTALAGLEKAAFVNIYGRAYRADVDDLFADLDDGPSPDHWTKIDDALRDACNRLAILAGGVVAHCVPEREGPSA
ncbi:MAG: hypothetical protein AAF543_16770 [Pseudomonadota bacterium]